MNRKEFLKRLGLIGAATYIAPKMMDDAPPEQLPKPAEIHQIRVVNKQGEIRHINEYVDPNGDAWLMT